MNQPLCTHVSVQPMMMDLVTHNSVVIEAASVIIWPHILNSNTWKLGTQLVSIGGEPGRTGERFKVVIADKPGTVLFHAENVEIFAEHRRTIRLNTPGGALIGFAIWQLTSQSGSTLVEYHVYCQGILPVDVAASLPSDPEVARAAFHNTNYQRFGEELAALKRLVEGPW